MQQVSFQGWFVLLCRYPQRLVVNGCDDRIIGFASVAVEVALR